MIMLGGNRTLSGGAGKDTFELNYSATKPLTAVIEDLEPSEDKIVVNFDGTGDAEQDNRFFEMLKLTNDERENPTNVPGQSIAVQTNLPALTLSDGLTKAAQIRAEEIAQLGESGILDVYKHNRPNNMGGYSTVFNEVGKHYPNNGENITAGTSTAAEAMEDLIG